MKNLEPGLRKVAVALYEHLATPRALTAEIMVRYGMWEELASLRADPACYLDCPAGAEKFRRDYQASEFLRKSPLLPIHWEKDNSLEDQAKKLFHSSEERCCETNTFFQLHELRRGTTEWSPIDARLDSILLRARKISRRMLGRIPDSLGFRFGPGTSYELQGSPFTTVCDKTNITHAVTPGCSVIYEWLLSETRLGIEKRDNGQPLLTHTRGNRFTTVAKDALTRRGICIEPLGNLVVQLSIGGEMKRRLGQFGLHVGRSTPHLRSTYRWTPFQPQPPFDGQHYHQLMAYQGSLPGGKWATIDLSNASDTVATELVRRVLPPDWHELLCAARCSYTLLDKLWVRLNKFSSMGNGFTFELLTTLIGSLVAAACELEPGHDLFVYGDDLLVPVDKYRDAMAVLEACGFSANKRKSFGAGPFRESCGGDFFSGYDVRPYYAKSKLEEPTDWVVMHNSLLRLWSRGPFLHRCVSQLPSRLRLFGPRRLGDRVLHGPFRSREKNGIHYVAVMVPTHQRVTVDRWSSYHMSAILLGGVRGERRLPILGDSTKRNVGWVTPRGAPIGYRIRVASIS